MKPMVSVIVPVYNGEQYIENNIKSMQDQTYKDIEVIYVDDGSKDNTGKILDDFAAKDDRIHVIHKKNGGVSAARNTGIQAATGEYVLFCDSDDEIEPDTIEVNMALALEHQADVVIFGFWYYNVDTGEKVPNEFPAFFAGNHKDFFEQHLACAVEKEYFNAPWNKLVKKSILDSNRILFDTRYSLYEDNLFEADIFLAARQIVLNPKMYYHYYLKSSGSLVTRFHDNTFEGLTLFYDRTMEYCDQYENNAEQIRSFDSMYVMHTYTYLKQISCNTNLNLQQKIDFMKKIGSEKKLLRALDNLELKGRKKIIRYLIKNSKYYFIILIYKSVKKIKK